MRILRILEGKAQKSPTDHKQIGGVMECGLHEREASYLMGT